MLSGNTLWIQSLIEPSAPDREVWGLQQHSQQTSKQTIISSPKEQFPSPASGRAFRVLSLYSKRAVSKPGRWKSNPRTEFVLQKSSFQAQPSAYYVCTPKQQLRDTGNLVRYQVAPVRTRIHNTFPLATHGFPTSRNWRCDRAELENAAETFPPSTDGCRQAILSQNTHTHTNPRNDMIPGQTQ